MKLLWRLNKASFLLTSGVGVRAWGKKISSDLTTKGVHCLTTEHRRTRMLKSERYQCWLRTIQSQCLVWWTTLNYHLKKRKSNQTFTSTKEDPLWQHHGKRQYRLIVRKICKPRQMVKVISRLTKIIKKAHVQRLTNRFKAVIRRNQDHLSSKKLKSQIHQADRSYSDKSTFKRNSRGPLAKNCICRLTR